MNTCGVRDVDLGKWGVIAQVSVKVRAPLSDARCTRPVPQSRFTPSLHTRLAQHRRKFTQQL